MHIVPAAADGVLQLLLSLDYEDDWVDNPVVAGSWGINWVFKDDFDEAFQVRLCFCCSILGSSCATQSTQLPVRKESKHGVLHCNNPASGYRP